MLFSVEQAFVGRDEIQAPLKTPAWEARFCEHLNDCSSNFTCQVARPSEDQARNGNESTLISSHFFTRYYPK